MLWPDFSAYQWDSDTRSEISSLPLRASGNALNVKGFGGTSPRFWGNSCDYGDEENQRTPWELFGEKDARQALSRAEEAVRLARETIEIGFQP